MTVNDTVATKPDWLSLRGKTLEGGFELGDVLEERETVAHLKVQVASAPSLAAYASFYIADRTAAAEQLQIWRDLRALRHPNLKNPLSCGRLKLQSDSCIYVVCAMPDETLSEILSDRGLTSEEARELLKSLGLGLLCLHSHGFVHGALSPEMAVAVGESIQISTECTRRINCPAPIEVAVPRYIAPESRANLTAAADVWCLGATIFESLVQKKFEPGWFDDLNRLDLGPILRKMLEDEPPNRAQITELVDAPANYTKAEAIPVPPSARVQPVRVTRRPVEAIKVRPLDSSDMQLVKFDPAYGMERLKVRVKSEKAANIRTIVAGVAALILAIVVIWLVILPKFESVADSAQNQEVVQSQPATWATRTVQPAPGGSHYHLIIGDYKNELDADLRIQSLNKSYPTLRVHKISKPESHHFFVVAGPPMNQTAAEELRQKALQMGVARTSYIAEIR